MHFLGGLLAGTIAVATVLRHRPALFALVVALISVFWEIFEYHLGLPHKANFAFDTSVDLVMDAVGALTIYIIARMTLWRSA